MLLKSNLAPLINLISEVREGWVEAGEALTALQSDFQTYKPGRKSYPILLAAVIGLCFKSHISNPFTYKL